MSVSLIALRFEIAENYPLLPHLHFSAPRPKWTMALADSKKGDGQSESNSPVGDVVKEVPLIKYRGLRECNEITIETLQNDDTQNKRKKKNKVQDKSTSTDIASGNDPTTPTLKSQNEPNDIARNNQTVTKNAQNLDSTQNSAFEERVSHNNQVISSQAVNKSVSKGDSIESHKSSKDMPDAFDSNTADSERIPRMPQPMTQIQFSSGNHFVEVTKGMLHLYKENQRTTLAEEAGRSEMLCIIGVPAIFNTHDLLRFIAPVSDDIEHVRIIRESKPNQYMVLIKFRNQLSADEFYKNFDGLKFNTIEDEVCHLAFVAKVETVKESEEACLPLPGHTELPTCPVCLERMDESVEGILTILCNHSFHGSCLAKWGDTSCPVCRYCQTPEPEPDNRCFGCDSQNSLWICLICGHIGCGRYVDGHAYEHYLDTQHTYAMQLGNNRVWDYAGDNYVHRLVQNKTDGKLVELEPRWAENEEKMDSMQLEYTYLLTSQLEAQRHYFEDKLSRFETEALNQLEEMKEKTKHAVDERKQLEEKLNRVTKEKQALDKKLTQVTSKLNKISTELKEEKEMNRCLRQNQHLWQQKLTTTEKNLKELKEEKEKEIKDLQEQVRDLMFYFEAQNKLQDVPNVSSQEIQEGQIVIGEATGTSADNSKQRRKKHR